jgi:fucose 4-O-acetylase-like acetyltransferase
MLKTKSGDMDRQSSRILWIDCAKVIGIWLVILGHMDVPAYMVGFIFAFHMPLFFFISGYLEKNRGFKETIISGIKALIVPYLLLYGLFYAYWFVVMFLRHPELYESQPLAVTLSMPIAGMLLGVGRDTQHSVMLNVQLWFLWGLFFVKIIHRVVEIISRKRMEYYVMGTGAVILLMFILKYIHKPLVLSIDCAILAFPFFAAGNVMRKKNMVETVKTRTGTDIIRNIILSIAGYAVMAIVVEYNGLADINNFIYGRDGLLFYVLGMTGIISTISISQLYRRENTIVTILSKGTIIIMALHKLLNGYLFKIVKIIGMDTNLVVIIAVSIVNIALSMVPIIIAQKKFTVLLGKN